MLRPCARGVLAALRHRARTLSTTAPASFASAALRYELPPDLVAQSAAEPRDAAKLLVALPDGRLADSTFARLAALLPPRTRLVLNESAVVSARLRARPAPDAALAEVMLLRPESDATDASAALLQPAHGQVWRAMVRLPLDAPGARLVLHRTDGEAAAMGGKPSDGDMLALHVEALHGVWEEEGEGPGVEAAVRFEAVAMPASGSAGAGAAGPLLLGALLDDLGETPLPPYIRRAPAVGDRTRYQAVYAAAERGGSVAAPTAGLHFTSDLLAALDAAHVRTSRLALHVGAGTFKPVTAATLGGHAMHSERFGVSLDELEALAATLAAEDEPLVPIGTTSARVLESLYWLGRPLVGVKAAAGTARAPTTAAPTG